MATLIYNENNFVRWDKTACLEYTITSLIDYSNVIVTVTSETNDYTEAFTLEEEGSNTIKVPCDGIYKICAVAEDFLDDQSVVLDAINSTVSITNIGQLNPDVDPDEAQLWRVTMDGGVNSYWATIYGGSDPNANWAAPPASYQSALNTIQSWLNANGGGSVEIVAPGDTSVLIPWLPIDNEDYQLIITSLAGRFVTEVVTAQDADTRPVFHYPDVDCLLGWDLTPTASEYRSYVSLGQLANGVDSRLDYVRLINGVNIYQSTISGGTDPNNDWSNPPVSYQDTLDFLNNYAAANGTGTFYIIEPGTQPLPWVPVDNTNWQLALESPAFNLQILDVRNTQSPEISTETVAIQLESSTFLTWLCGLTLDGTQVLDRKYDLSDPDDYQQALTDIRNYLAANGGGQVIENETSNFPFFVVFENCPTSQQLTMCDPVASVEECDYIYELCQTYECITRLMTNWLCQDPCLDPCDNDYMDSKEAREKAIELSTLFFHALMPLITQDRLWYFGNWDVSEERTCHVNNIKDLFQKICSFLKTCGFDCYDPCAGCNDDYPCDPCSGTTSYAGTNKPCTGCS